MAPKTISRTELGKYIIQTYNAGRFRIVYDLITRIDTHLTLGTFHFHRGNKLLFTLDQVIDAIIAGELAETVIPPVTREQVIKAMRLDRKSKFRKWQTETEIHKSGKLKNTRIEYSVRVDEWITLPRKLIEEKL